MKHPVPRLRVKLHYEGIFEGFPLQESKGPFYADYLARLILTMRRAMCQYARVYAIRVDLKFPRDYSCNLKEVKNDVFYDFMESFKAKVQHNRAQARKASRSSHDSQVRYVAAREESLLGHPHYHLVAFLNYDAFKTLGFYELGRSNLFNRLIQAWASALCIPVERALGLVNFPSNPDYRIDREDSDSQSRFVYRASYICKVATKVCRNGEHSLLYSRI